MMGFVSLNPSCGLYFSMPEWDDTPNFHPDFCLRVLKGLGVACSLVAVTVLVILIVVDPSGSRCPGWLIRTSGGQTSLWLLFVCLTVLPTLWVWYIVLRWDTIAQKQREILTGQRDPGLSLFFSSDFLPFLNMDQLMVGISIGWWLFCTIIPWTMIFDCTELPRLLWPYLLWPYLSY